MFIIIYRPENALHCETKHIGPFTTYDEAYDYLIENVPSTYTSSQHTSDVNHPGARYIEQLIPPMEKKA